jgi:hypothetical protein
VIIVGGKSGCTAVQNGLTLDDVDEIFVVRRRY